VPLVRLLKLLLQTKQVIVCGGSVISARTGSYQRVLTLAKLLGVRRIFFSIEGSGWPRGRAGILQRWIMHGARISTRTFETRALILRHLPTVDVTEVIDAFYLHSAFDPGDAKSGDAVRLGRFEFARSSSGNQPLGRIVVLPRSFPNRADYANDTNIARLTQVVDELAVVPGSIPVVISPSADIDIIDPYVEALQTAGHRLIVAESDERIELTPETHVVSNRLHIAKASAFFSIPNSLLSYDRKTESPDVFGETGRILRMTGEVLAMNHRSIPLAEFALRRAMSHRVLKEALVR